MAQTRDNMLPNGRISKEASQHFDMWVLIPTWAPNRLDHVYLMCQVEQVRKIMRTEYKLTQIVIHKEELWSHAETKRYEKTRYNFALRLIWSIFITLFVTVIYFHCFIRGLISTNCTSCIDNGRGKSLDDMNLLQQAAWKMMTERKLKKKSKKKLNMFF